jgi:diguanylate cyclase (GGDEF)-like protein/PAS domain S-box-containing protein
MMPYMDGYQVCQRLKAEPQTAGIPIIFLTAKQGTHDKIRGFKVGGVDYISKPFQIAEVLVRVENQLLLARQQQQLRHQNECLQREIDQRILAEARARSQQRFLSTAIDAMPSLVSVKDVQGRWLLVNQAFADLYNTSVADLIGKTEAAFNPNLKNTLSPLDRHILATGKSQTIAAEALYHHKRRDIRWFQTVKTPLYNEEQQIQSILSVSTDISERRQAESLLVLQAERERVLNTIAQQIRASLKLNEILEQTVIQVRRFMKADRVLICQYRNTDGSSYEVVVESPHQSSSTLVGAEIKDAWFLDMTQTLVRQTPVQLRTIDDVAGATLPTATQHWLEQLSFKALLIVPLLRLQARSPRLWGLLIVAQCHFPRHWQIGEQEVLRSLATSVASAIHQGNLHEELAAANQELKRLAHLDGLTELANRRYFDECLHRDWQEAIAQSLPLSLILLDIDYFKQYNDAYGHLAGDDCLKAIARSLQEAIPSRATAARYGGEEFAIILPETPLEPARECARSLAQKVRALAWVHQYSPICDYITLSMGVASTSMGNYASPTALIAAADRWLYLAKERGRDRICSCQDDYCSES